MKASTELDNLLNIAEYSHSNDDDGRHGIAKNGWDYYKVNFKVGNQTYEGLINIAKSDNKKVLYDITKLKKTSRVGLDKKSSATNAMSLIEDNIPQNDNSVKSDTSSTKYSMLLKTKNTQELDNSSFSMENDKWREYLNKHYKSAGTRTQMNDILVATRNKNLEETKINSKYSISPDMKSVKNILETKKTQVIPENTTFKTKR